MVDGHLGVSLVFQVLVVAVLLLVLGLTLFVQVNQTAKYQETADDVLMRCENIGYSCEYATDCRGAPTMTQLTCEGLSSGAPTTTGGVACCSIV